MKFEINRKFQVNKKFEVHKKSFLGDLLRVGPEKPMGYLPLDTVRQEVDVDELKTELEGRGLVVWIEHAQMVVFDRDVLNSFLAGRKDILQEAGWPYQADDFVRKVMWEPGGFAEPDTPLCDLVAEAFGRRNSSGAE